MKRLASYISPPHPGNQCPLQQLDPLLLSFSVEYRLKAEDKNAFSGSVTVSQQGYYLAMAMTVS